MFFNIFASFLAFSTSSQKNLNLKGLLTRSTFNVLFLKLLVFLIEVTWILLVLEKKSNTDVLPSIWKKKDFFSSINREEKNRNRERKIHKEGGILGLKRDDRAKKT